MGLYDQVSDLGALTLYKCNHFSTRVCLDWELHYASCQHANIAIYTDFRRMVNLLFIFCVGQIIPFMLRSKLHSASFESD